MPLLTPILLLDNLLTSQPRDSSFLPGSVENSKGDSHKFLKLPNQQDGREGVASNPAQSSGTAYEDAEVLIRKGLDLYLGAHPIGRRRSNTSMYMEAIKYFDMALEINPRSDSAWSWKGKALNYLRRYAEAIVCFDKAIAIRPVTTEPRHGKAEALISLGRREEAIRCYDEGLEVIGPRFPRSPYVCRVWAEKGVVLNDLGRYAEAIVCFDKALAIDPQYDYARKGRMLAVGKLEKRDSRLSRLLTWRR